MFSKIYLKQCAYNKKNNQLLNQVIINRDNLNSLVIFSTINFDKRKLPDSNISVIVNKFIKRNGRDLKRNVAHIIPSFRSEQLNECLTTKSITTKSITIKSMTIKSMKVKSMSKLNNSNMSSSTSKNYF